MQNTPDEFDDILNIFEAESTELLKKLGDFTLTLEQSPDKTENIPLMFQTLHSLKGSARMLGFIELQDIAHHLEDILTLVKNNKKEINAQFFELFYDSYDILQAGINACVQKKTNQPSEEEKNLLEKLDRYINEDESSPKETISSEIVNYFKEKSSEINAYIMEIFVLFQKCDEKKIESFSEAFMILSDISKQLSSYFIETNYEQVKNAIEVFSFSCNVEEDEKNSSNLLKCKNLALKLKDEINQMYSKMGLNCLITNEQCNFKEEEKIPSESDKKDNNSNSTLKEYTEAQKIVEALDELLPQLQENRKPLLKILELLHQLLILDLSENTSAIIMKMSEEFNFIEEHKIDPDISITTLFLYCFNVIKMSVLNDTQVTKEQAKNCIDKLSLIQKIFNVGDNENKKSTESKSVFLPQQIQETKPIIRNTDLTSGRKPQNSSELEKFFKIFENEEIKTLRVDTNKLDKLVAQTGELIINVIKTQEHLSVIEKLNSKLTDWYSESKKIANFLKYFDKKIVSNNNYDEVIVNFYRKVYSFFYENTNQLAEMQTNLNYLFKKVLEDDTKLNQVIMEVENISKNIRVLPLATVFHMFPRMVRDIAKSANKEIEFVIHGSDTAVDKKIIEEIKSPLIHILRNSIDHGIELPEERVQKGKNRAGKIVLTATQDKNSIIITIEDDGVGINVHKIKERALERNLLTKEELDAMTSEQLTGLIFWPGFSTGDKVTEISGRGIGLDVVQTKLAQLNGKVTVHSVMDKGCRVVIELPITMSTTKVFVISFTNQFFAIPMNTIKLVQWINPSEIFLKDGRDCILYEEHSIPIFNMAKILNVKSSYKNKKDNLTVIVVEVENTIVAFTVEHLLGDQEILNKKLSLPIYKLKNIGGITTLPSGDICLILNMNEVVKNSLKKSNSTELVETYTTNLNQTEEKEFNPSEKQIIVFDSTGKLLDYMKKCLKFFGYNVRLYTDKDALLSSFIKTKPDMIISNYEPELQQEKELIYKIKGDENYSDIKLMLISSCSQYKISQILSDITTPVVIEKNDYSEEEFLKCVENILR